MADDRLTKEQQENAEKLREFLDKHDAQNPDANPEAWLRNLNRACSELPKDD